jgi:hypothetical protein
MGMERHDFHERESSFSGVSGQAEPEVHRHTERKVSVVKYSLTGANGQMVKPSVPVCPVRVGMVVLPPSYEQPFRDLKSPLPLQRKRAFLRLQRYDAAIAASPPRYIMGIPYLVSTVNLTGADEPMAEPSVPVCPVRVGMVVLPPSYEQPFRDLRNPLPLQRKRASLLSFASARHRCFSIPPLKPISSGVATQTQRPASRDERLLRHSHRMLAYISTAPLTADPCLCQPDIDA